MVEQQLVEQLVEWQFLVLELVVELVVVELIVVEQLVVEFSMVELNVVRRIMVEHLLGMNSSAGGVAMFIAQAPKSKPHRVLRAGLAGLSRVWILTAYLTATSLALYLLRVRHLPAPTSDFQIPWWVLMVAFCATEISVVHIQLRRDAHSFSLSEVPLVIGLVFMRPGALVLAQVLGTALALGFHRRQAPLKLIFNLSHFALECCLASIVFHGIADGGSVTAAAWGGAFAATSLASLVGVAMIFYAIFLSKGEPDSRQFRRALAFGLIAAATNTSLGLIGIMVLSIYPAAGWLLLVPAATLFLAYRAYAEERRKHESLSFLYEATRIVNQSPGIESSILALLSHARKVFKADLAELTVATATNGGIGLRTTLGPADQVTLMQTVTLNQWPWAAIDGKNEAVFVDSNAAAADRYGCELRNVMVAPILGETRVLGTMMIANHLGAVSKFDAEDLKLLQTLVNHLSVWLENSQLEHSLEEVTTLKEQLKHQAFHDSLTGLANRDLFADRVEQAMARGSRSTNPIAVLFLDLDDFKTINDSLGHTCGDDLLGAFAGRLQSCLRPGDAAARLGGDEFAVLLEGLSGTSDAVTVAERIDAALLAPFELQGKEVSIGSSIGIALSTPGRGTASDLLRNADVAMYAAKNRGKNRYEIFQPSMHVAAFERLELKEDLQRAVERRELVLHYQPIVRLDTGRITGLEALVRWNHPRRGLVTPADFIPLAEETGLIHPLGRWVLNEACRQTRLWQARYPRREPLTVNVNLSAKQLHSESLTDEIASALRRSGLLPRTLTLEITESVLLDRDVAMRQLVELRKIGVRVAIDDFGTGYSSLSYLNRFPIDILKVDRSFVRQVGTAPDKEILAHAVLDLTRTLGLEAVAEGIEQRRQGDRLLQLGCKFGQGYWYSKPLDAEQIEELLAAGEAPGTSLPARELAAV
jgi:diguanylate cyclase (GGDEF)-like protein